MALMDIRDGESGEESSHNMDAIVEALLREALRPMMTDSIMDDAGISVDGAADGAKVNVDAKLVAVLLRFIFLI